MATAVLRETVIQMATPTLTVPIVYTVYGQDDEISNSRHFFISLPIPDYDFLIIAEVDLPAIPPRLKVLEGVYWVGAMQGQGNDYHILLGELRETVGSAINELFPADVMPD